jgi:hypothetical protein
MVNAMHPRACRPGFAAEHNQNRAAPPSPAPPAQGLGSNERVLQKCGCGCTLVLTVPALVEDRPMQSGTAL